MKQQHLAALRHANAELLHELADSGADLSLSTSTFEKKCIGRCSIDMFRENANVSHTSRNVGWCRYGEKIVRTMKVVILLAESGHFTISSSKFSRSGVAAATMRNRALETISQYILSAGQVIANTPPPPLPPQKTKPSLSRVLSKQDTIQVKEDKEEEKEEDTKPPPPPPRPPNMSELKRRMSMKTTKKMEQEERRRRTTLLKYHVARVRNWVRAISKVRVSFVQRAKVSLRRWTSCWNTCSSVNSL